jgi:formamidopyrimidine-DNA glycosylase
MPELPDITIYIEALEQRILNRTLKRVLIGGPFLLRTADPPLSAVDNRTVRELRRIGKRIAIGFDNDVWLVLHLMIAGRLHWVDQMRLDLSNSKPGKPPDGRRTLAAFEFDSGTLTLTEAGSRKRASLHVVAGEGGLAALDPGGIDPMMATAAEFASALTSANHTLKRSLTDPRIFSGIGNAYSDEILHRARLSPVMLTSRMNDQEIARLHQAVRETMLEWTESLRDELRDERGAGDRARRPFVPLRAIRAACLSDQPGKASNRVSSGKFPEKVTAFREGMAVHGRYGQPCPRCGAKVQRIRYASNETNYCARCQTGGKLLADRALSRLLREDWPRTLEELEERKTH